MFFRLMGPEILVTMFSINSGHYTIKQYLVTMFSL